MTILVPRVNLFLAEVQRKTIFNKSAILKIAVSKQAKNFQKNGIFLHKFNISLLYSELTLHILALYRNYLLTCHANIHPLAIEVCEHYATDH